MKPSGEITELLVDDRVSGRIARVVHEHDDISLYYMPAWIVLDQEQCYGCAEGTAIIFMVP